MKHARQHWTSCLFLWAFCLPTAAGSPASISVEIVTQPGVQSTAPREWLQLLTGIGQRDVSLRSARPGDQPKIRETGSDRRPRYRVVGLLGSRGELLLPGGKFTLRSRDKLADYFDRLAADGVEGVTAERGRFGLTEKEFRAVHADLSQPLVIASLDQLPREWLGALRSTLALNLTIDRAAIAILQQAAPIADEVEELTIGTGVALVLRHYDLVLVPEKKRGEEVAHRIARKQDIQRETWPVGWKSQASTSRLAPKLMETLNAEVDGFTLAEAMDSIAPRAGVPFYWDHATLRERKIDPKAIEVQFARKRTHLKRVVNSLLFQARLKGELKVDEAGRAFLWISR